MRYRESEEMYLETIFLLTKQKDHVRGLYAVKEQNNINLIETLQKNGYIVINGSGEISFTDLGKQKALSIYERHSIITKVLTKIGATEEIAEENACRFEHAITPELLAVMKNFLDK